MENAREHRVRNITELPSSSELPQTVSSRWHFNPAHAKSNGYLLSTCYVPTSPWAFLGRPSERDSALPLGTPSVEGVTGKKTGD